MASFWKPKACGKTELPDRLALIGQKLVENAKIQKYKCDILGDFQILCFNVKRILKNKVKLKKKNHENDLKKENKVMILCANVLICAEIE